MSKVSKSTATVLVIALCLGIFGGIKMLKSNAALINPVHVLPQRAHGNPNAEIKIIEFIDFQCPACANGVKILREYFQKYPDKMYVELRYFPLAMHKHGMTSARWSECAARQGKFWPFFDLLIDRQKEWGAMVDAMPSFEQIAKEARVHQGQLNSCLQDSSVDQTIKADMEEGQMRSVQSTPTYFVNHEIVVGTKSLRTKLDSLLGVTPAATTAGPTQ